MKNVREKPNKKFMGLRGNYSKSYIHLWIENIESISELNWKISNPNYTLFFQIKKLYLSNDFDQTQFM